MKRSWAQAAGLFAAVYLTVQIELMAGGLMLTTVARFDGTNGTSGTTLVLAKDGNFYGVSEGGGSYQLGTVFRLTPAGELSAIASFDGTNGALPYAGLVQGTDGDLYGTAFIGGSQIAGSVFTTTHGTIYKVSTNGLITSLHSFNSSDGEAPICEVNPCEGRKFLWNDTSGRRIH